LNVGSEFSCRMIECRDTFRALNAEIRYSYSSKNENKTVFNSNVMGMM
jgi:hypothetical protein